MKLSKLNKHLLIFVLFFSFFISIGYSVLNASLSVAGDLVYRVPADIRITGVKISSVTNGGVEQYSPKYTKDTVSVGLKLPNLNSTVVYEVTIKNSSSKKKKIATIANKVEGNTNISYTYADALKTTIAPNSTITILFTYKYNSDVATLPVEQIKESTISLTYTDFTLYEVLKLDANTNNHAKAYTGDTSTFSGKENIYYYYGETPNNNVLFGDFCWKMFRTTDTGGVKMVYNGEPDSEGKCGSGRENHAGYQNRKSEYIPSDYIYGTDYMYNEASRTFTLVGTLETAKWSDSTSKNLVGKYTCKNTTGSCSKLYYILEYLSNTNAYALPLSSTGYYQIGESYFNTNSSSPTGAGYMYNDKYITNIKKMTSDTTDYKYGNTFTYNEESGEYTLSGETQHFSDWSNNYSMLENTHYTCWNTGGTCKNISYIYYTSYYNAFYINLENGVSVEKALEEMFLRDDANTANSSIKNVIDVWYSKNMTKYTRYLEDTVWCNSRKILELNGWKPDGGKLSEPLYFWSFSNSSNLTCPDKIDSFTVDSKNGNGALTYPVGLVTRQEQYLAYSDGSPLSLGKYSWTLSPYSFESNSVNGYQLSYSGGAAGYHPYGTSGGVCPAVSLRSGIEYLEGNGTTDYPYIILTDQ